MITSVNSTSSFCGRAVVKIDNVGAYEKFRNDLNTVAQNMKKRVKYDKTLTEPSKIPGDTIVVNGMTFIRRRGKAIGVEVVDKGPDDVLLAALRKVFGSDKVLEWDKVPHKKAK